MEDDQLSDLFSAMWFIMLVAWISLVIDVSDHGVDDARGR